MRRASLLSALFVIGLGLALFGAWMHWSVLDPTNVGWLLAGEDRGQSAIGTAAYLRAGGPWPRLYQPLLAAPEGMTLLFTDSIPLIGFMLKPLAGWLPAGLQFIGPWYLLSTLLQVLFAWLLVRRHVADPLVIVLGTVLLAAMPALFNRYGHASLCAQWLILWGLWIFVDDRRSRSVGWWPAVLALAAMVHSYLLLMVAALWGSAVLMMLARGPNRLRIAISAVLSVVLVGVIAAAHGVFNGSFLPTASYGSWPVALDAWWNPQNPGYTALLPSSPDRRAIGFEGFQYLGAGLLLMTLVAGWTAARGQISSSARALLRRLCWLLPAFAVLALVAIGPSPLWRGQPLFELDLPLRIVNLLDPVRAAGRLVWPVTYTLTYAAIVIVAGQRRAPLVLGMAVALQVIDIAPMMASIRATSARADDPTIFSRTLDPRWNLLVARATAIEFEPPEPYRDLQLMEEVTWRAIRACRPVRYFYASREAPTTRARIDTDAAAFREGRIDPTRFYVLLDGRAPLSLAGRVRYLDGIAVIPPSSVSFVRTSCSSPRSAS